MNAHTVTFTIGTRGKGTYEITDEVARVVRESGMKTGTATVFIRHTSASLVIYENADHSARTDLHEFFERLVPEDADYFVHTAEGPDDMPSHLQMVRSDCRRTRESNADHGHDHGAAMRGTAVLEKEDALPSAERQSALGDGNRLTGPG